MGLVLLERTRKISRLLSSLVVTVRPSSIIKLNHHSKPARSSPPSFKSSNPTDKPPPSLYYSLQQQDTYDITPAPAPSIHPSPHFSLSFPISHPPHQSYPLLQKDKKKTRCTQHIHKALLKLQKNMSRAYLKPPPPARTLCGFRGRGCNTVQLSSYPISDLHRRFAP